MVKDEAKINSNCVSNFTCVIHTFYGMACILYGGTYSRGISVVNFQGTMQVWKVLNRRSFGPVMTTINILALKTRGPGLVYQPNQPFDCYRLSILTKKNDITPYVEGSLIQVSGRITTYNSTYGEPGDKWGINLECEAKDVSVIGQADLLYDPADHIKKTGSNSKGIASLGRSS